MWFDKIVGNNFTNVLNGSLNDDNRWYCSYCKKHVRAEKTVELWRLLNILIVHLKRFEFIDILYEGRKLETLIDFPLEELDVGNYCVSFSNGGDMFDQKGFLVDDVPACYDLFALVNHYGRMGFGHLHSFCKAMNK